ncbi:hypothetical protein D9Q98_006070 [Chlorella vulgaris]|uniref:Phytanoyl-CoA dioxygenase family protein n=1 Tax=Chlorella vulgaris TaxID=3077 RepID=A0A9D4TX19_CHLVU|nr:hypothetical protein D9Q98_006070 [Chlorella vulgaris]
MTVADADHINCAHELQRNGFAVLPQFLDPSQLEQLRLEADTLYELAEAQAQAGSPSAAAGWGREHIARCVHEVIPGHQLTPELRTCYSAHRSHRSSWPLRGEVWHILFCSQLTRLVLALLGPEAVLFNDQHILKPPCTNLSSFPWHRDSDWCRSGLSTYQPYISVWCALDDTTVANGCLVVQPFALQKEQSQDVVALEVAAGTAVIMSDTVLHRSGPNRSRHMRRAWMPQFAARKLSWHADGTCVSLAIPLNAAAAEKG